MDVKRQASIRVRIAPSPTGTIHVGLVRTALYNWLLARQRQGKFILRIEDTDPNRSSEESARAIIDGFQWLGITFDEGPYYQSQRFDIHRKYARRLLDLGKAYHCWCPAEELERERQEAWSLKQVWKYDRRCLRLAPDERQQRLTENRPFAVRFLVPERTIRYHDLVHGTIEKSSSDLEDFILLRADTTPTYNFAVVVDDAEMGITHVIRAVEHITSTFKQILLYEALGFPVPEFAHLPLILGKDRKKLSKRMGATSIEEFRKEGYLPEALVNFLALLGWSPGGDREILTLDEMIREFSLERVNKADAVFDPDKLAWMNSEYLRRDSDERLMSLVSPFLAELGIDTSGIDPARLKTAVALTKVRVRSLREMAAMMQPLLSDVYERDSAALAKYITPESRKHLILLADRLSTLSDFSTQILEATLRSLAQELNVKPAALIHPSRVALTGRTVGPPLFDVMAVLGRERTLARLRSA